MNTTTMIHVSESDEIRAHTNDHSGQPTLRIAGGDLVILFPSRAKAYEALSVLENHLLRTAEEAADEAAARDFGSDVWIGECAECEDRGWVAVPDFGPDGEPSGMEKEPCPTCRIGAAS